MKILIDADACPKTVLQVCLRLGKQYKLQVWTVASFNHHVTSDHHVVVGNAPQEADIKVMNLTQAGDIVVTQDWGLAAAVLGKGALAISPMGKEYRAETIDFMLEEREIKAKLRRGGGRTKGPSRRTLEDDQHFTAQLQRMLQRVEEMDDATQ